MRWQGRRESGNVEDARGQGSGGGLPGGRLLLGGGSIGGVILLLIIVFVFGVNPNLIQGPGPGPDPNNPPVNPQVRGDTEKFVAVVLADTEDVWHKLFRQMGKRYEEPKLKLFSEGTESGCGFADSAVGPFYCPADGKIYLDLRFFDEMRTRFKAPGDFAQAYVIAHEVGHHVQNLLGTMDKVHAMQQGVSKSEKNKLSVRLELQADFYAGVWAHHAQKMKNILEPGDIEEALRAANAIGDDRLQMQSKGYVVPDSFTHGSSEQRIRWFKKGFHTGDLSQGDTFSARDL